MKLKNTPICFVLALSVFAGTVNAKINTNTDLVTDKAITMSLIEESFDIDILSIDKADLESDVRELLAQKPYTPKTRLFARHKDIRSTYSVESEE